MIDFLLHLSAADLAPAMDRDKVLSQRAVEALIADGHVVVIFQDYVLRLDSWLRKHPGGELAILHMVGRDATDEMTA
ncbi:hypothetical protein CDD83_5402 [Cordyceps sp. RAO-2017]|nr:hypothetical protein CDD83_5402 [Cordyceps sp. RAO-2017]